jgi:hypothetical protein
VLKKIEKAFQPGDPALELIPRVVGMGDALDSDGKENSHWVTRFVNFIEGYWWVGGSRILLIGLSRARKLGIIICWLGKRLVIEGWRTGLIVGNGEEDYVAGVMSRGIVLIVVPWERLKEKDVQWWVDS